jgi:LysM repeat protein
VGINVIYRDSNGLLSAVRRTANLEGEATTSNLRINGSRLSDLYLRPDGQFIDGHLSVDLSYLVCSNIEIKQVSSVKLDEEGCFELSRYPSVTLVKAENESLWELAKTYHSSIEQIKAYNELEESIEGKLLLIPKAV